MNVGTLTATLGVDSTDFEQKLNRAESKMKAVSSKMAKVGAAMSLAVTAPLMLLANKMVGAWDEAIQAETRLTTAIRSTGGVAGKTTEELVSMSQALQKKTTFGDDMIQGAQGLLLTFTQVRGEIYDKAIPAIMDMSTMLGQDLQSSATMVGKALNEPIRGVNAMRRVGVSFTEEQVEQVKALVAAGKQEEAQMIILTELQAEFGGQAEAAAKKGLGPMKQMQNNIGDLMEQFGKIITEALTPFFNWLSKLAVRFQSLSEPTKKFIVLIAAVSAAVGPVLVALAGIVRILPMIATGVNSVATAFKGLTKAMLSNPYVALAAAIIAIGLAMYSWYKSMNQVSAAQKRLNSSIADARKQIASEQMSMNYLFEQLKKTNEKSEERSRLIKTINETYGEYLPYLLTEKSTLKEIEIAQRAANDELAKSILLKAKEQAMADELAAIYQTQTDALNNLTDALQQNGYNAQATAAILYSLTESLKAGDTFATAFYKSMGKNTSEVLAMKGNVMDYVYDLSRGLNDEKIAISRVSQAYDVLIKSMGGLTGGGGAGGNGGGGDGEDEVTKTIGAYEKLGKQISDTEAKLKDLVTLVGQGTATAEQQSQIPVLTKELNELIALKTQIDETWITSSKRVKDEFDADLEAMSKSRQQASLTDRGVIDAEFAAKYETLDKLYDFEMAMYGHLSDEKARLDKEYQTRREKLDSEYMLHVEDFNQKERQAKLDTIDEIRRAANDAEDVAINLRQEYYNTAMFLSQSVIEGLIDEAEKVELLSQLYKKLKEDIADASDESDKMNNKTFDFQQSLESFVTSIPDSIQTAIDNQRQLKESFSDTMQGLKNSWMEGSMTYREYLDGMYKATDEFEKDSKKIGFGKTIMSSIGDLLISIGKAIIGIGLATEAMQQAFENPYIAIAAGAAAIALGMYVKNQFQGLATGGEVVKSGAFLVGEEGPELVNLRAGAAVTPNHLIGSVRDGEQTLVTRIAGRDLEIILQRSQSQTGNRRGRGK